MKITRGGTTTASLNIKLVEGQISYRDVSLVFVKLVQLQYVAIKKYQLRC